MFCEHWPIQKKITKDNWLLSNLCIGYNDNEVAVLDHTMISIVIYIVY